MNEVDIKLKILNKNALIPNKRSKKAAGFDLFACIDSEIELAPRETVNVPIGIAMEIPEGYFGAIVARSGLAHKERIRPSNCLGVIDSDYRGEVKVSLHNDGAFVRKIFPRQRIAQLVILPCLEARFQFEDKLSSTDRGENGFGSTGK